jgi:uncharacterized membrane-anchored protein YhcB (DUF1043 family)
MLEQIALDPLVAAASALLGVLLGLILGRLFLPGPRHVKRLQAEIDRLGRERAEYQARVAGHFQKTGELIGRMTQSYKDVYDHLADGAQSLCGADALPKPAFTTPRLIVDDTVSVGGDGVRTGAPSDAATRATPEVSSPLPPPIPAAVVDPLHVATPAEGGASARDASIKTF